MNARLNSEEGFTVLELVVAASILLVALIGVVAALGYSAQSSQMMARHDRAMSIANTQIELARNLPYDSVGTVGGNPPGVIVATQEQDSYSITTDVTWARDSATGQRMDKKIIVTVSWETPGHSSVSLSTSIFGKSTVVNAGDVEIRARYLSGGDPVSGATFVLAGTSRTSGSDGIAFFGAIPLGTYDISVIPPPGYIYSSGDVVAKSVAADSLSTVIITFQRPSSVSYSVTNASTGASISGITLALLDSNGVNVANAVTAGPPVLFSNLLPGVYTLNFSGTGYRSSSQSITVSTEGSAQSLTLALAPLPTVGSINVTVLDHNGANLNGATVSVQGSDGSQISKQTSGNSSVSFAGLLPGNYTITMSYTGYITQSTVRTLLAGDGLVLSANLLVAASTGRMTVSTTMKHAVAKNCRIVVSGSGYFNDTLTTDASGNLSIDNLPVGSYTVKTYTNPSSTATVLLTANQTTYVTVDQKK